MLGYSEKVAMKDLQFFIALLFRLTMWKKGPGKYSFCFLLPLLSLILVREGFSNHRQGRGVPVNKFFHPLRVEGGGGYLLSRRIPWLKFLTPSFYPLLILMTNHFASCKSSLYAKVSFVDCEYSPEKRRVFLVLQVRKKYLTCKSILQLVSPCFFFSLRMLRLMVLSHTIFSKIVVVLMICWDLDQALTLRQHCRMQRNCAGRLWTKKSQQSEDKHNKYIEK